MNAQPWVLEVMDGTLVTMRAAEWSAEGGTDVTRWMLCPVCGAADWCGHEAGCSLAEQIAEHEQARIAVAELIAATEAEYQAQEAFENAKPGAPMERALLTLHDARVRRRAAFDAVTKEPW